MREQAYAYLVSVLPGRYRDPKLIDYGLRERFGVRGPAAVTVVDEKEPQPQPNPEPWRYLWNAN